MIPGEELLFCALGGSGEIGMNVNLYGCEGKWVMVDLGLTFADPDYPGVELILPDLAFIEQNRETAIAILGKAFALDPPDMADVVSVNRYTLTLDEQMVDDMDSLASFLLELKRISNPVKAADWIDPTPLKAVRADLVRLK